MSIKLRLRKGLLRKVARSLVSIAHLVPFRASRKIDPAGMHSPLRVLILNGAHIGDIVVSTSILPILRSAYPDAEIGFVVGSWASMVVKNHEDISYIHVVDHWWHNRSRKSRAEKYKQSRSTYKKALSEIRELKYDLALCIYPYLLPDFMDLAWKAKIPVRLGFKESLYAPLATAAVDLPKSPFIHQSAIQAAVLEPLHLKPEHLEKRRAVLPGSSKTAVDEVCALMDAPDLSKARYQIIHIGTGSRNREMPPAFWKEIAESIAVDRTVLFTGQGEREAALIAEIIEGKDNCISGCNKLSWDGFVAAVRHAERLYGVESMAGHVAGAVGTPAIVVYSGMAGLARWRPEGPVTVISNHLECAPCNLPGGCESMACIRGISAADVIKLGSH